MFRVYDDNKGILNERRFASVLDKKRVGNLSGLFQELIYAIYGTSISSDDIIECWQSKYKEKADIKIKINGVVKGISIKMGSANSVHLESLDNFCEFLTSIGVSNESISTLQEYVIGLIDNERVDNEKYKILRASELNKVNNELNDLYIRTNLIIRCLFKGSEINRYDADAIIHGTPDYFVWATKSEVLKYLMFCHKRFTSAISVGSLNVQSWNRSFRSRKFNDKYYVQIKWHMLKKDLNYIRATSKKISEN